MIYFKIDRSLTESQKASLLSYDKETEYYKHHGKSGYHNLDFAKAPGEITYNIIKSLPNPDKITLVAIDKNKTVPIHTDGNYGRKTVIIFPITDNYAPCIADNIEIPYMTCYAFNTQVPHTVINNSTRRVSLQLWYDISIEDLQHRIHRFDKCRQIETLSRI